MDASERAAIVREILRGVPASTSVPDRVRLLKARLRTLGDEIGEPLLADGGDAPDHYVTVEVPMRSSLHFLRHETLEVSMTRAAADALLRRA